MIEVAPDLFVVRGFPHWAINIYVLGDVLLDAGTRWAWPRLTRELQGVRLSAHALTHGHPDHQGCSKRVCETHGVPLWCGAGDADAVENGDWISLLPWNPVTAWGGHAWVGPPHPVARRLREGDEVGGFTVIETPGHSPGHVSYWRERDGVLITGDTVVHFNPWKLGVVELRTPPGIFTVDRARNIASARKLAVLEPRLICFGHGPPLRDTAPFLRFLDRL